MSYFLHDPDEWTIETVSRPCTCAGKCDGRCNGMFGMGMKRRPDAEIAEIKRRKQEEHEEAILAEAAAIMARRNRS